MDDIQEYYKSGGEATRLQKGIGRIEWSRTQILLRRYLPHPPAVIYDIGGGTGVYSHWLAGQGYTVHLIDLTYENLQLARGMSASLEDQKLGSLLAADGRALPLARNSADVVLVMGPLYHLHERVERLRALEEARRGLKPGGRLFASAITRYGNLLWGLWVYGPENDFFSQPPFRRMVDRELADGQHLRPEEFPGFFTRAFFHRPEELLAEVQQAGFRDAQILAVEGPGWLIPALDEVWADPHKQAGVLEMLEKIESVPELMGVSPHFLVVGSK